MINTPTLSGEPGQAHSSQLIGVPGELDALSALTLEAAEFSE